MLPQGHLLGHYSILHHIGSGEMGECLSSRLSTFISFVISMRETL